MSKVFLVLAAIAASVMGLAAPAAAAPPTADSGPSVVAVAGTNAVLSGTASDPDGDALEIRWLRSVVSGGSLASCTFSGPIAFEPISAAGLAPTLNCTTPGQYLFQLVAADGTSSFDSLGTLVTFTPAVNHAPIVDSGPDVVATAGTDAVLAGSASDPDGDPLEIRWIRTVVSGGDLTSCTFTGPGGFQPISAAGLAPTLNCTVPGEYLVQLVAGDGITSVDDIGALVTFTAPITDLTAPTCKAIGQARGGGFVIRVSDPQSGVSAISTRSSGNAIVQPANSNYSPAVPSANVIVRQFISLLPGAARLGVTNGDGVSRDCIVVVHHQNVTVINT